MFRGSYSTARPPDFECCSTSDKRDLAHCYGSPTSGHSRPSDFLFLGHLDAGRLHDFHMSARMVVLPSRWFETFGIVVAEAMMRGKPAICSRIGSLPEVVDEGVTGLLFEPGNAGELAEKIRYLWERPELCRSMGRAGREKCLREYSSER